MATRNVTLALPPELVRRAKVIAAERDTSVSALVAGLLEELVREDYDDHAWEQERRLMAEGLPMRVGAITWSRDDVHGR